MLCLPEKFDNVLLRTLITTLDLKAGFPKEYDAWERSKSQIGRRFQGILSQRKAEMHAKIERDFEGNRVKVQRAVVSELLKTFP